MDLDGFKTHPSLHLEGQFVPNLLKRGIQNFLKHIYDLDMCRYLG